ncbi:hypothetical protein BDR26DRAFT_920916 [Obelidium mucronatum]|nr:hypothetical protein BDR26DRAFT_920916 [Obelidium mucronatum]
MTELAAAAAAAAPAAPAARRRTRAKKSDAAAAALDAHADAGDTAQTASAAEAEGAAAAAAAASSDDSKTASGACLAAVSKRLRNLKNRLTKLEAYAALPPKDLEKDQVEALLKRGEVAASVKELEDVVKALAAAEIEEVKISKQQANLAKMTEALKVTTSVMEANNVARENARKTLELTFALSTLLPNISQINVRFTEAQFSALTDLKAVVLGTYPIDTKTFFENADRVISDYVAASASEFSRGVTFAELNTLIQSLVSPPAMPKFGISAASVVDNVPHGTYEEPAARSQTPTMGRSISFFAQE